jgi:hypothetical protein
MISPRRLRADSESSCQTGRLALFSIEISDQAYTVGEVAQSCRRSQNPLFIDRKPLIQRLSSEAKLFSGRPNKSPLSFNSFRTTPVTRWNPSFFLASLQESATAAYAAGVSVVSARAEAIQMLGKLDKKRRSQRAS